MMKKTTHQTALERFQIAEAAERTQRDHALDDLRFAQAEDGQWDDAAKESRKNRPRYTINRVAGSVNQITGDQRQQRTNIKVQPLSGGASNDIAKTLEGLIRNIESQSKAQNAYDSAFDEMVNGGFGGWRVATEYEEDGFNQTIKIKPIKGATTSLWFDPAATEKDKSDAQWAFVTIDMPRTERELKYPDMPIVDFAQEQYRNSYHQCWAGNDTVKVAEYWYKDPINRTIALMSNGAIIDLDEDGAALNELAAAGVTVVKERKVKGHKVKRLLIDGAGVLEESKDWAGKYIPLIPLYGHQIAIEGETYTRGLVRLAKDPARIYNYTSSTMVEASASTPKDPFWITPAQAKGHEGKLANFNKSNDPFLFYNPDPVTGGAAPQRGGAPAVQQALIQQTQQASMDLYHVTGMQPPSMGINPELKSGKAIRAQEALGDRGNYIFSDNLAAAQQYTGEILIDLIPRIIDTERQESILKQDGETETVELNKTVRDEETGENIIVNDLSLGKYTVKAETGPAFATQRQESAQQIIDLMASSPVFESLAMDLVAKDLPILESKELTKRVRKMMIKQGTVEPTEDEVKEYGLDQQQAPDPQQTAITENIQIQSEKLISEIENKDADTLKKKLETQNSTIEAYAELLDAMKAKTEAGLPIDSDDVQLMIKQQDIMEEAMQQIDEGPNRQQAADIVAMQQGQAPVIEGEAPDSLQRVLTVNSPSSAELGQ